MNDTYRVGIGYDIHRLHEGRRLMLGGIEIDHEKGLLGHSDADVVLHAVADAMLGAVGLPDLGEQFPDTDPLYKDANSRELLADVVQRVAKAGYEPCNVDIVVHLETPKLSPYKKQMADSIGTLLGLPASHVSVKAKTNEGVGPIGKTDAIACTTSILVARKP